MFTKLYEGLEEKCGKIPIKDKKRKREEMRLQTEETERVVARDQLPLTLQLAKDAWIGKKTGGDVDQYSTMIVMDNSIKLPSLFMQKS